MIIPIDEWENFYEQEVKAGKKRRLTDLIGAAKGNFNTVEEIDEHINELRDQWDQF